MEKSNIKKYKILYIGDDTNIINLLKKNDDKIKLINKKNTLLSTSWLSENNNLDAILCETYLPGMNGIEFYNFLKTKKKYSKITFILINNDSKPELTEKAFNSGIDDFYVKPLNADDILTRIKYLKSYKLNHSHFENNYPASKIFRYKIPLIKRIFDIISSSIGLIILSPLFLIVALLIWTESGFKGSIFYKSKRVGTGYKIFDFYKFRSMRLGAENELKKLKSLNQYQSENEAEGIDFDKKCPECERLGHPCSPILIIGGKKICENSYLKQKRENEKSAFIKIKDDPRITKIGKFLRNTSIDELPQLINVLKGDMSLVGNRPLPLYEAELITSDNWIERFLAPSGITGLWQVNKRGKSKMSEYERKQLDNQYARNNSFLGDIKIILKTIPALFQKENV